MASKIPWTLASEGHLLEVVRQKRFLWDHKHELYSKTKLGQGAFDAIAEELQTEHPEPLKLNVYLLLFFSGAVSYCSAYLPYKINKGGFVMFHT